MRCIPLCCSLSFFFSLSSVLSLLLPLRDGDRREEEADPENAKKDWEVNEEEKEKRGLGR